MIRGQNLWRTRNEEDLWRTKEWELDLVKVWSIWPWIFVLCPVVLSFDKLSDLALFVRWWWPFLSTKTSHPTYPTPHTRFLSFAPWRSCPPITAKSAGKSIMVQANDVVNVTLFFDEWTRCIGSGWVIILCVAWTPMQVVQILCLHLWSCNSVSDVHSY